MDPQTSEGVEPNIPITVSFIQWLTLDNDGRIWFAAQSGSALDGIFTRAKSASAQSVNYERQQKQLNGISSPINPIHQLGFSFGNIVGPAIAVGIGMNILAYAKSATDLRRNIRVAMKLDRK